MATDYNLSRTHMDHLLCVALQLLRGDAGSIVFLSHGIGRVIAHKNLSLGNASFPWSWNTAPYKPTALFVKHDIEAVPLLRALDIITGKKDIKTFVRKPILVEDDFCVSLQIYGFEQKLEIAEYDLKILDAIAKQLKLVVRPILERFIKTGSLVTIAATTTEMIDATLGFAGKRALFDDKLRFVAASTSWAEALDTTTDMLVGKTYEDTRAHFSEIMSHLGRRALETGFSIPEIDFSNHRNGITRQFTLKCSPIRPVDGSFDMLDAHIIENTQGNEYLAGAGLAEPAVQNLMTEQDGIHMFLLDTLLKKRSIKMRDGVSYITVRAWRESIKKHQISALKACKKASFSALPLAAGFECADEIVKLVGVAAFKFVVPVPCGHSSPENCMSFNIAKAVAAKLGLPVVQAFAHLDQKGSSHPKTNLTRKKMQQIRLVPGPAIVVDDVATSGMHLSEASKLLKANGTDSLAISWIGGEGE
jgi:hypothetical protein